MNCPTCPQSALVMSERSGIEIDYCPTCRGVWLDRGELDKIIERVNEAPARNVRVSEDQRSDRDDRDRRPADKPKKRERGSFLTELFEMGSG